MGGAAQSLTTRPQASRPRRKVVQATLVVRKSAAAPQSR